MYHCNLLMIPCTSKIPAFYCREMEISVAEGKHSSRDGACEGEKEVENRGREHTGERGHTPRMF